MGVVRIVLDTNILVRANPTAPPEGLARELLRVVAIGPATLIVSEPLLEELGRVLRYPRLQTRWALCDADIDSYLNFLKGVADFVEIEENWVAVPDDPDDDPIFQTAVVGRADVLCTRDPHFSHPFVKTLCRAYGIRILDDISLMDELR
jgi:putative PIN family toxin of toxin-antitoxin system